MIIDSFMFYNEYDMLEARLEYLYNYVDLFVIVESNITFAGNPKELNFLKHKSRYKKYLDKVFYYPIYINPTEYDFSIKPTAWDLNAPQWKVEHRQRNAITDAIRFFSDDAVIILGDCDEIPDRDKIVDVAKSLHYHNPIFTTEQKTFLYNKFNKIHGTTWRGTAFALAGYVKQFGAQECRNQHPWTPSVSDGGWHLSYWGSAEFCANKIKNFSHQEYNTEHYTSLEYWDNVMKTDSDPVGRGYGEDFNVDSLPKDFYNIFRVLEVQRF